MWQPHPLSRPSTADGESHVTSADSYVTSSAILDNTLQYILFTLTQFAIDVLFALLLILRWQRVVKISRKCWNVAAAEFGRNQLIRSSTFCLLRKIAAYQFDLFSVQSSLGSGQRERGVVGWKFAIEGWPVAEEEELPSAGAS